MGLKSFWTKCFNNKNWLAWVLLLCTSLFIKATYEEILNDKNKQIEIYQKEIDDSRTSIKNNSLQKQSFDVQSDSLSSQLKALNDFLKDYQNQNFLSPEEIAIETNMVIFLEDEVQRIQKSFRSKIINLYKHGKNYELELLLSSKTPNEYLRRNQYLQKFAQSRKKELRDLKSKKFILEEKKKLLSLSVSSQRFYIENKRNERTAIEGQLASINAQRNRMENDNEVIQAKIEKREEMINRIKNFISQMQENKQNFKGTKTSRTSYNSDQFEKLKGMLILPTDFALIQNDFGTVLNNSTNTKVDNNGIDLSIAKGSKVYSVASGTVSLVGELPYYGKVIIINHDNGYRTVYASLSDVSVNPGDKVKLNQIIAHTGSTPEGQMLHFELWSNSTPLNPKEWLRF